VFSCRKYPQLPLEGLKKFPREGDLNEKENADKPDFPLKAFLGSE